MFLFLHNIIAPGTTPGAAIAPTVSRAAIPPVGLEEPAALALADALPLDALEILKVPVLPLRVAAGADKLGVVAALAQPEASASALALVPEGVQGQYSP